MGQKKQKKNTPNEPVSVWTGEDLFDFNKRLRTVTIIFRTIGCHWKGCTMCGYQSDCAPATHDELMTQLKYATKKFPEDDLIVKIFTSGSFLDEREVSKKSRNEILSKFSSYQNVKKIIVESRPEFIEKNVISDSMNHIGNFEIGIGVETSNDLIRDRCINKGFSFEDFVQAAEIAKECGASIKAYLLLKPPYLSEKEAIEDAIKSAIDVSNYASTISLNLCNIQNATKVYDLWKNGCYRPPWLWSAVEVIKRIKVDIEDKIVLSDPIGAGFNRGPHNCGRCDRTIADKIRKFSLLQDISIFDDVHCECEEIFKREMHLEEISFGSPLIL